MTWSSANLARPEACAVRRACLARDLLDRAPVGYCLLEVRARAGEPVDLRFVDTNVALDAWGPLADARGPWARSLLPGLGEELRERLREVPLTSEGAEFELRGPATGGRAVRIFAACLGRPKERLVGVLVMGPTSRPSAGPAR